MTLLGRLIPWRAPLAAALLAFAAGLLVLGLAGPGAGSGSGSGAAGAARSDALEPLPASAPTTERLARLQAIARERPTATAYADVAGAALQLARESADPTAYDRAGAALREALRRDPRDAGALTEASALAAARHRFPEALAFARRARAAAPRGAAAPTACSSMPWSSWDVPARPSASCRRGSTASRPPAATPAPPTCASCAATSPVPCGRCCSRRSPPSARASRAPRSTAWSATCSCGPAGPPRRGRLPARARPLPRPAQARDRPGPRGRRPRRPGRGAERRLAALVARLPLTEQVVLLGETQLARGERAAARETFALVEAQRRLLAASGVRTDAELALFEADHGDPARAVAMARRAVTAQEGLRAPDALGWALTRAGHAQEGLRWARRALALAAADPVTRLHAALAAGDAGRPVLARRWLQTALEAPGTLGPLRVRQARRALEGLS